MPCGEVRVGSRPDAHWIGRVPDVQQESVTAAGTAGKTDPWIQRDVVALRGARARTVLGRLRLRSHLGVDAREGLTQRYAVSACGATRSLPRRDDAVEELLGVVVRHHFLRPLRHDRECPARSLGINRVLRRGDVFRGIAVLRRRNKIVEDVKITPNEVKHYFEKIPTDSLVLYESEVEVGQVVVYPKASRDAEQYCIEQLAEYKKQIDAGKKDFCAIASLYSEDPGSKDHCGRYEVNRNQKDLDPTWLSKAFTLKEGQISNPFKSKFGYHIIQLISRAGDDVVVRHILKIPQVTQFEMKEGFDKLDSVRANLIAGTISFGTAVAKYSNDDASKFTAGMIQGRDGTFMTIDQLDKDMVAMMKDLKVGEYSKPTEFTDERGKKGVRIVYLKTRTEPHRENMKDDYSKIAQRALEEKKENTLEKWFNNKIQSYYIMVDNDYKDCKAMEKWVEASKSSAIK